jgi:putative transposase
MGLNPDRRHRRSIRLRGYDYSAAGAYFVTICTWQWVCFFGEIEAGEMHLNEAGLAVRSVWLELPDRFPGVTTDEFVIMPNHVHGIIVLGHSSPVGARFIAPNSRRPAGAPAPGIRPLIDQERPGAMTRTPGAADWRSDAMECLPGAMNRASTRGGNVMPTLREIVRMFKAASTRRIREQGTEHFAWQRNYYEHIIRNEESFNRIRQYIAENPAHWPDDEENPANASCTTL